MELENDTFYLVDGKDKKWIIDNREDAIARWKDSAKTTGAKDVKILNINTAEEKWEISQVSSTEILEELIKEE